MRTARFVAACGVLASLGMPARPASAEPTPVAAFLHALHGLGCPADTPDLLPAAQENPSGFLGQVFEVPATVTGLMTGGGQTTALLAVGQGVTVSVRLPASLAAERWLSDTGSRLRALIQVDRTGNDQSLSSVSLLAAAPEDDVEDVERREAARERAALLSRRAPLLASRMRAYQRETPSWTPPSPLLGSVSSGDTLSPDAVRVLPAYREAIHRLNTRLPGPLVDTITANILGFSERYGVDPRLVIAMMIAESGFDIYSTSRTGAMGLGQLMPETARGLGVTDAYDPVQNIAASVRLLRGHLEQYGGQISLTMAAYNAGPGAVRKYHGVPPYRETQHYVAKVADLYRQLCGG